MPKTAVPGDTAAGTLIAAWWLPGPHLQTLWAGLVRHPPRPAYTRERLVLYDGAFVDLCWVGPTAGPVVVVLHGVEDTIASPSVGTMLDAIAGRGWRSVLMHFRGCSGEPNRQPRTVHSSKTQNLRYLLGVLARAYAGDPAIGWSSESSDIWPVS